MKIKISAISKTENKVIHEAEGIFGTFEDCRLALGQMLYSWGNYLDYRFKISYISLNGSREIVHGVNLVRTKESSIVTHPQSSINHPDEIIFPAVPEIPATPDIFNGLGELVTPGTPMIPGIPAVIRQAYTEIIPAWDEIIYAEYSWDISAKLAEITQEDAKLEAKRTDRISRIDQFKLIDWSTIDTLAEIKVIVRALVKEAIRNDE